MGKKIHNLTVRQHVELYLSSHSTATQGEIYKALVESGKIKTSYNNIGKIASIWRKGNTIKPKTKQSSKSKKPTKRNPKPTSKSQGNEDINDELRRILIIMETFQDHNLPVPRLGEVLAYIKEQKTLTQSEDEFKSSLKHLSNEQLLNVIYQSKKLQEER